MPIEKIKNLAKSELITRLRDYQEEARKLRFDKVVASVANNQRLKIVKRQIARIKTLLREYELGIRK